MLQRLFMQKKITTNCFLNKNTHSEWNFSRFYDTNFHSARVMKNDVTYTFMEKNNNKNKKNNKFVKCNKQ